MVEDASGKLLHDGEKKGAVAVIGMTERWGAEVMPQCHLHPWVWLPASTSRGTPHSQPSGRSVCFWQQPELVVLAKWEGFLHGYSFLFRS